METKNYGYQKLNDTWDTYAIYEGYAPYGKRRQPISSHENEVDALKQVMELQFEDEKSVLFEKIVILEDSLTKISMDALNAKVKTKYIE